MYSNTYNPPYEGELTITYLNNNSISGDFNFRAKDVDPQNFVYKNVSVSYTKVAF